MKKILYLFVAFILVSVILRGQVSITVDIAKDKKAISPFIYGRNNTLSDDPTKPLTAADWIRIKDAGVRIVRENHGNNSTKYNWRLKLESHPDWYNNVYDHDWDYAASSLQTNAPGVHGMWGFQLIGKAASNKNNNFNDWDYYINHNKTWAPARQNLAGGGQPNPTGDKALIEGNPALYLENWTADSTIGILNHWFGANGIGLDKQKVLYWNMDNEPEIWNSTHDDVMPVQLSAEDFMQRYFTVAKKARALYPGIKLAGPVTANEWQWYNWNGGITEGGKKYCWLEYFIKRIGEEQKASGVRLLDVLDIHFYPGSTNSADILQCHRVFFDKNYDFPEANGVKNVTGSWDITQTKEYIFERCREWLVRYIGNDHGVTFGVSETGIEISDPNVVALWYASMLGEFMKHDVELFTPWTWRTGMWEVLHLFSRYNKPYSVQAISSQEESVSAYASVNANQDSVTVVLVNRSNSNKSVTVNLSGFIPQVENLQVLSLSNLPQNETFISHSQNALSTSTIPVIVPTGQNAAFSLTLPPLSIKSVLLKGSIDVGVKQNLSGSKTSISPNPVSSSGEITIQTDLKGKVSIDLLDMSGRFSAQLFNGFFPDDMLTVPLSRFNLAKGNYVMKIIPVNRSFEPFSTNLLIF